LSRSGEIHPLGGLDSLNGAPHPLPMKGISREGGQDVLPEHGLERLAQSLLGAFDRQNVAAAPTHKRSDTYSSPEQHPAPLTSHQKSHTIYIEFPKSRTPHPKNANFLMAVT